MEAEKENIIKKKEINTKSATFFSKEELRDLVKECLVEEQNATKHYRVDAQNRIVSKFRTQLDKATSIDDIKNINNNLLENINNTINIAKCFWSEEKAIFKNEELITKLKEKLEDINKDDNKYEKDLMEENNKPNSQASNIMSLAVGNNHQRN